MAGQLSVLLSDVLCNFLQKLESSAPRFLTENMQEYSHYQYLQISFQRKNLHHGVSTQPTHANLFCPIVILLSTITTTFHNPWPYYIFCHMLQTSVNRRTTKSPFLSASWHVASHLLHSRHRRDWSRANNISARSKLEILRLSTRRESSGEN
jgi:hypothetical protein